MIKSKDSPLDYEYIPCKSETNKQEVTINRFTCHESKKLIELYEISIMTMASLVEYRDSETGFHIQRTKLYVQELCNYLRKNDAPRSILSPAISDMIILATPLHDIGKIAIPDSILNKPGRLTTEEYTIMKTHTTLGQEAIMKAERLNHSSNTFFHYAAEIAYSHHEKWDGSGYPLNLKDREIPLSARIVAIADVYDALISKRIYKPSLSHEIAVNIIAKEAGKHFDPDLVRAFLDIHTTFQYISNQYKD